MVLIRERERKREADKGREAEGREGGTEAGGVEERGRESENGCVLSKTRAEANVRRWMDSSQILSGPRRGHLMGAEIGESKSSNLRSTQNNLTSCALLKR